MTITLPITTEVGDDPVVVKIGGKMHTLELGYDVVLLDGTTEHDIFHVAPAGDWMVLTCSDNGRPHKNPFGKEVRA
jgi:hypothetical protein